MNSITQFKDQAKRQGRPVPDDVTKIMKEELILREIYLQEAAKLGLDKKPEFAKRLEMARESILISELMDNYQKTHPVSDEQARAEYDRIAKLQRESASDQEYKAPPHPGGKGRRGQSHHRQAEKRREI